MMMSGVRGGGDRPREVARTDSEAPGQVSEACHGQRDRPDAYARENTRRHPSPQREQHDWHSDERQHPNEHAQKPPKGSEPEEVRTCANRRQRTAQESDGCDQAPGPEEGQPECPVRPTHSLHRAAERGAASAAEPRIRRPLPPAASARSSLFSHAVLSLSCLSGEPVLGD